MLLVRLHGTRNIMRLLIPTVQPPMTGGKPTQIQPLTCGLEWIIITKIMNQDITTTWTRHSSLRMLT